MNKKNITIISSLCLFYTFSIHSSEHKKQEKKVAPNALAWGLENGFITHPILAICKADDTHIFKQVFKTAFPLNDIEYFVRDRNDNTPLHIACKNNNTTIAQLLLENNIDLLAQNNKGQTPLHIACENGCTEMVQLLCNQPAIIFNVQDKKKLSVFHVVSIHNYPEILKILLDALQKEVPRKIKGALNLQDENESTALNQACTRKHEEIAKQLLAVADINPNIAEHDGSTPLHNVVENHCYPIMQLLLKHPKINPNKQNFIVTYGDSLSGKTHKRKQTWWYNNTPLHLACYKRDAHAIRLLVQHPATQQIPNYDGEQPFEIIINFFINSVRSY